MSITAICSEEAARSTVAGTASAWVVRDCHSQTARGVGDASVSPGSATETRAVVRCTKRMPGARRNAAATPGAVVRTSAMCRPTSRRTTIACVVPSAAASARLLAYPTESRVGELP